MARPKTIIRRQSDSESESGYKKNDMAIEARVLGGLEQRKNLKSRAERIAGDHVCQQGWRFKDAEQHFPDEPWMRTVGRYYPDAIGGPLLVDEPEMDQELKRCERKQAVLEGLGYRYLVIKKNMTDAECFMELEACGQRIKTQSLT